jgi:signal transduction histidine kinase
MPTTGTILIVEDNPVALTLTRDLLEPEGYALVCCGDGQAALAAAEAHAPDLVLLDVMLPGMTGFDVCRHLRATPRLAEVPIVMLTALSDRASRLQGLRAGADDFLSRPVDREELLARIRTIMRLNRYRRLGEERRRFEALSRQLLTVQERERRSLAVELHDEIGQVLTAVKLRLLQLGQAGGLRRAEPALAESLQSVDQALQQVRQLALDLRPSLLDDLGLEPALRWLLDRYNREGGPAARLIARLGEPRLPAPVEIVCFRVVQEALTNVRRHARASRVLVFLKRRATGLALTVRDDGAGFDVRTALAAAASGASLGLLGMQERVQFAGGLFTVTSAPGRGTRLRVWVPRGAEESHEDA